MGRTSKSPVKPKNPLKPKKTKVTQSDEGILSFIQETNTPEISSNKTKGEKTIKPKRKSKKVEELVPVSGLDSETDEIYTTVSSPVPDIGAEYSKLKLEEKGFEFQILPSGNKVNLCHKNRFKVDGIHAMMVKGRFTRTIECKYQNINIELLKIKKIDFI